MTIQEALDILAQENSSGMSPEELSRRDTLIRGLSTTNPELAMQVARGPYQMNVGNSVGDSASPTEAWQRGPSAMSNSDYPYSPSSPKGPSQMQGVATPSTTGPIVPGQPPARYNEPGVQSSGSMGSGRPSGAYGPTQGPLNPNGQYGAQPGQVPTININVNGQPQQQGGQTPSWLMGASQDSQGNSNERAVYPGPAMSSMSNNNYPYSPSFPPQSMAPSAMGQARWNQAEQGPKWYEEQFNPPIPQNPYNNGAYNNNNYPMSPMWAGQQWR